jgi:hypothetical protein
LLYNDEFFDFKREFSAGFVTVWIHLFKKWPTISYFGYGGDPFKLLYAFLGASVVKSTLCKVILTITGFHGFIEINHNGTEKNI